MMLSLNLLKAHNAPPDLLLRYQTLGQGTPMLLHSWWKTASANDDKEYRNDMIWILENIPPDLPHKAWINLGMELLEHAFPCLKGEESGEATAYFAKAADHLFWCNKAVQLGKHPAYFAAQVYSFTLQCAQAVRNTQTSQQLDHTMLTWL